MKVASEPIKFQPVTLTLESEGELRFLRDVLGGATGTLEEAYGITSPQTLYYAYLAADRLCKERGLTNKEVANINLVVKEQ
jgi:hypothetical protein